MTILYIIGGFIFILIIWTVIGTARRMRDVNKTAAALSPAARQQFIHWDTQYNKALTLGKDRDAKLHRARALVVAATNTPISDLVSGNVPILCQPGHIDGLSDGELDELIDGLQKAPPITPPA